MASRHRWSGPSILAAILAAGLLLFWSIWGDTARGPLPGSERPDAIRLAEGRGAAGSGTPSRGDPVNPHLPRDHGTGSESQEVVHGDTAPPVANPVVVDSGTEEADRLLVGMAKLLRDLEYSPGLPEPTQQAVVPPPEPWRGDPSREGPPPVIGEVAPLRLHIAGGDRVLIRGRNLRVVQVMFGNSPARLLSASGSLVAVESPPGRPGLVAIAVTNDDGTWAVAQVPVAYVE